LEHLYRGVDEYFDYIKNILFLKKKMLANMTFFMIGETKVT